MIDYNPSHALRKPRYQVHDRPLSGAEYRNLGGMLRQAQDINHFRLHARIFRFLTVTGGRRREIINL